MKRLGVILQYYNSRNDLPILLDHLAQHWDLVLFARKQDLDLVTSDFEKRAIPPLPRTLSNRFQKFVYQAAGNIPSSKQNYRFWNKRRIGQQKKLSAKIRLGILLQIRMLFSGLVPFDKYMSKLTLDRSTKVDDVDAFFAMSDVYDINFMAQALETNKPFVNYIYSWDHVGKYHSFSKQVSRHMTWHKGITQDLCELHKIDPAIVNEIGSTQLTIVENYISANGNRKTNSKQAPYVYYAGTMGYPEAITQEMNAVKFLANTMARVAPDTKLVVRPYPNSKMFSLYNELANLPGLELENVKVSGNRIEFLKDTAEEKYSKIKNASLVVHMGSTIGLEAAYFDTPVVHLAMEDFDYGIPTSSPQHISHTLAQRHLQKYMLHSQERNVVRQSDDLSSFVRDALDNPENFLKYNNELTSHIPLRSMTELAQELTDLTEQLINPSRRLEVLNQ